MLREEGHNFVTHHTRLYSAPAAHRCPLPQAGFGLGPTPDLLKTHCFYPHESLKTQLKKLRSELPGFSVNLSSAAYCEVAGGLKSKHWIEPHWHPTKKFDKAEIQMYFPRTYHGNPKGEENYLEFNQLVTHLLDIHWSPNKSSYCKFSREGEEDERIMLIDDDVASIVLIRRESLDKILHLGKWSLVRYFDFTRWKTNSPGFDTSVSENKEDDSVGAIYEIRKCGSPKLEYIEYRGAAISKPVTPKKKVFSFFDDECEGEKKYCSFVVQDIKNSRILQDYSLKPSNFANYFTQSELPFEISPIFFKPEVLDKYKQNPDRYDLTDRHLTCHGAWDLQTYDVNEHGQVHTYAIYLGRLPYREQLHWLQFNEEPKGPISKQAIQTDFLAQWPDELPPILKLRSELEKLQKTIPADQKGPIWLPKGGSWETASKGLHMVHTENANQWHDFIIALANVVNEGLQIDILSSLAAKMGIPKDEKLRTLGLLGLIVEKAGNDKAETHGVLNSLQIKRGRGKAHGTWDTPKGSLVEDAGNILRDVIGALGKISDILQKI